MVHYIASAVDGLRHDLVQAMKVILRQVKQIIDGHTGVALKQVAVEYLEIKGQALQAPHAGFECSKIEIMIRFQ